jgi:hypothetical protein
MPGDLLTVAAIVIGFGITVFMFRVQRELQVLESTKNESDPDWKLWLAWADYLVISAIVIAALVSVPILISSKLPAAWLRVARGACAAAMILQVGYIPSILAHYRIEIGANRKGPRQKGEPAEKLWVYLSMIAAIAAWVFAYSLG